MFIRLFTKNLKQSENGIPIQIHMLVRMRISISTTCVLCMKFVYLLCSAVQTRRGRNKKMCKMKNLDGFYLLLKIEQNVPQDSQNNIAWIFWVDWTMAYLNPPYSSSVCRRVECEGYSRIADIWCGRSWKQLNSKMIYKNLQLTIFTYSSSPAFSWVSLSLADDGVHWSEVQYGLSSLPVISFRVRRAWPCCECVSQMFPLYNMHIPI